MMDEWNMLGFHLVALASGVAGNSFTLKLSEERCIDTGLSRRKMQGVYIAGD